MKKWKELIKLYQMASMTKWPHWSKQGNIMPLIQQIQLQLDRMLSNYGHNPTRYKKEKIEADRLVQLVNQFSKPNT